MRLYWIFKNYFSCNFQLYLIFLLISYFYYYWILQTATLMDYCAERLGTYISSAFFVTEKCWVPWWPQPFPYLLRSVYPGLFSCYSQFQAEDIYTTTQFFWITTNKIIIAPEWSTTFEGSHCFCFLKLRLTPMKNKWCNNYLT